MICADFMSWLKTRALPLWLSTGFDEETGLFRERLLLDGTPDRTADLRLRTGFRQIYVAAHAGLLGLAPRQPSIAIAVRALDRLRDLGWGQGGRPGWVHSIGPAGEVVDGRRDLYDHAFALHAMAWAEKAVGTGRYGAWIDETLAVIDEAMAAPHGGWAESDGRETPRRQNPHMHLFEACLALYETGGDPRHLARAGEIFGLFRTRFFDEELGTLREFFGPAWEGGPAFGSERLDPGHMMEWVWLLRRYSRASGTRVDDLCARLFAAGMSLGRDPASGFLVDEVDARGRSIGAGRRLWPQTEYLKALLVQHEASGDVRLAGQAEDLCRRLLDTYLADVPAGGWRDHFALSGDAIATHIPASTLYHLFAPAAEILRLSTR